MKQTASGGRVLLNVILSILLPVLVYVPLNVRNGDLLRQGRLTSELGLMSWCAIWVGSVTIGYVLFARRLGQAPFVAIAYFPAMLTLLGYLGLVTGLYFYGDGP
jgi:hypothetical protein